MAELPQAHIEVEADPKRPWKAAVAAVAAFVVAWLTYYVADQDPFTLKDAAEATVAGLVASGVVGGTTFMTRNPLRARAIR